MDTALRALLVDDNEINTGIIELQLRDMGFEVFSAGDGEKAVSKFEESEEDFFDIIIMDIMMPVMDGIQAIRNIRRLDRADAVAVPIIAITANSFSDYGEVLREEGVTDCISKPFSRHTLEETVRSLVGDLQRPGI